MQTSSVVVMRTGIDMRITLHGVITAILVCFMVPILKMQGDLRFVHIDFVKEVIEVDDFQDRRIESLEKSILKGECILTNTMGMSRGLNNTIVFKVRKCDGTVLTFQSQFMTKT